MTMFIPPGQFQLPRDAASSPVIPRSGQSDGRMDGFTIVGTFMISTSLSQCIRHDSSAAETFRNLSFSSAEAPGLCLITDAETRPS